LLRRVTVLLALVLPLTLLTAPPASAGTESEFVSRTNGARTSRGLRAYAVRSDLTSVARRQAARMAASRQMYHNPNLRSEVGGWQELGENVGQGGSVSAIHSAFMGSYSHRANILSTSYTEVGIGTAQGSDGQIYVSEVFRRPYGSTTYTPPAPRPAPVYRAPPRRASRSGTRRTPVAVRPPVKKRVVVPVDRTPKRLRLAIRAYRRVKPVDALDQVMWFVRVNRVLAAGK
jgi:hypothetical protein